jgi:hypothetical protein
VFTRRNIHRDQAVGWFVPVFNQLEGTFLVPSIERLFETVPPLRNVMPTISLAAIFKTPYRLCTENESSEMRPLNVNRRVVTTS